MAIWAHCRVIATLALGVVFAAMSFARGEEQDSQAEPARPFVVKLVDEEGKPVSGAIAGLTAYFGSEGDSLTAVDETGWKYWRDTKSDDKGIARFAQGRDLLGRLCI